MRSPGLAALVDDGAFLACEAQLQLLDDVGEHDWLVDFEEGWFRFDGERPAQYGVQLLGSAAPGPRSWLWGWANPSAVDDEPISAVARAMRHLGERDAIHEFTEPELAFADFEDPAGAEPGYALAYDLSIAARVVSQLWFGYSGRTDGGTRFWMLLDGPRLAPPSAVRTARVLGEGLRSTTITDHRRALTSYAALREVPWDGSTMSFTDGDLAVSFDERGRIAGISGTAGAS